MFELRSTACLFNIQAFLIVAETCCLVVFFASSFHFCFNFMKCYRGGSPGYEKLFVLSIFPSNKDIWRRFAGNLPLVSIFCFEKDLCLKHSAFKKLMMEALLPFRE